MKRERIIIPKGIYGITGDNLSNGKSNLECVKDMICGGIRIIQYRDKNKTIKEKIKEAREISRICRENDVIFIVNDHVDIAILVDAEGQARYSRLADVMEVWVKTEVVEKVLQLF